MAEVKVTKTETFESALKRFKRNCQKDGTLSELRKREHYEKPSVKRKKKEEAAPAAPAGPTQEELLTQIRDLLKK